MHPSAYIFSALSEVTSCNQVEHTAVNPTVRNKAVSGKGLRCSTGSHILQALTVETSFTSALSGTELVLRWLLKVKNQEYLKPFLSARSYLRASKPAAFDFPRTATVVVASRLFLSFERKEVETHADAEPHLCVGGVCIWPLKQLDGKRRVVVCLA